MASNRFRPRYTQRRRKEMAQQKKAHKMNPQKRGHREYPRPSSTKRGYGYAWQKARATYLAANPLCVFCAKRNVTAAACVIDHIRPVEGPRDPGFWLRSNWQALCAPCHDQTKQRIDRTGTA